MNDSVCHDVRETKEKVYPNAVGTFICCFGAAFNIFILIVFKRYKRHTANTTFLQILAVFDLGVLVTYMILFPAKVFAIFQHDVYFYRFYVNSVAVLYPLSRFCQMSTSYITIVAAFERVITMSTAEANVMFQGALKFIWVGAVVFLAAGCHVSRYFEIVVKTDPNCSVSDIAYQDVGPSALQMNGDYRQIYGLFFTNIVNTVLPFAILFILTTLNTCLLMRYNPSAVFSYRSGDTSADLRRRRLRDQTMVLIVMVITYLILNTLSLVLSLTEFFDKDSVLITDNVVYGITAETINLCAILNSSVRLINYSIFNKEFRDKEKQILGYRRSKMQMRQENGAFPEKAQLVGQGRLDDSVRTEDDVECHFV